MAAAPSSAASRACRCHARATSARWAACHAAGRSHPQLRNKNRRYIGISQSQWTALQDGNAPPRSRSASAAAPPPHGPAAAPPRPPRRRAPPVPRRPRPLHGAAARAPAASLCRQLSQPPPALSAPPPSAPRPAAVPAAPCPTRVRCVSVFLDKNRRYIGKSQSKRPPTRTQRTPHLHVEGVSHQSRGQRGQLPLLQRHTT
jgi:hypothetical protein